MFYLKRATCRQTNTLTSQYRIWWIFIQNMINIPPAQFQRCIILTPVADKPSQANVGVKGWRQDFWAASPPPPDTEIAPLGKILTTFKQEQVSHHLNLYLTSAESIFGSWWKMCSHQGLLNKHFPGLPPCRQSTAAVGSEVTQKMASKGRKQMRFVLRAVIRSHTQGSSSQSSSEEAVGHCCEASKGRVCVKPQVHVFWGKPTLIQGGTTQNVLTMEPGTILEIFASPATSESS